MNRLRAGAAVVAGALALLAAAPGAAQAHPLGNFTTNQYAGLRVTSTGIDVDYVLDLAELPAYQARQDDVDTDRDGRESSAELTRFAAATCDDVVSATAVRFGDRDAEVSGRSTALTFPPGAGGLTTLRLECALHADGRVGDDTHISFRQNYLAGRIGWREITAVGDRNTLTSSTVPAFSTSGRLTAYPKGVPTEDIRSAELTVRPGGPAAPAFAGEQNLTAQTRGADRFTRWFTDLVGHPRLTWGIGALAVLIAFVLGGAHAAAPGHGKTIMAAYLVGARGRVTHALTMALTVAITHTAGVLMLGLVLATSLQFAPDGLYAWLRLISGVLVAVVGAQLLRRALANSRARAAHHHMHHHDHDHGHGHHHDHHHTVEHSHGGVTHRHPAPAADEPFRVRSLLAMGFAGGLSPSPSAVVVLLGAAALGRAWYGVVLVIAYGIGLAAVLTGIGLALARWGDRLRRAGTGRFTGALALRLPALTAGAILAVGIGMAAFSLENLYTAGG
jgi:nickel/cobalt transporter (NicO) family protein